MTIRLTDNGSEMDLDLQTGQVKKVRKLSAIDWLLKYLDIEFKGVNGVTKAKVINANIIENSKEYEISGVGELANDAVKALANDIKGEIVRIYTDNGFQEYFVTDSLEFIKQDNIQE